MNKIEKYCKTLQSSKHEIGFIKNFTKIISDEVSSALSMAITMKIKEGLWQVNDFICSLLMKLYEPHIKKEDIDIKVIMNGRSVLVKFGNLYSVILMCGFNIEDLPKDKSHYETDLLSIGLRLDGKALVKQKIGNAFLNI